MQRNCCCGKCSADPSAFIIINANGPHKTTNTPDMLNHWSKTGLGCGWDRGSLTDDGNIFQFGGHREWPEYDGQQPAECKHCCLTAGPWNEDFIWFESSGSNLTQCEALGGVCVDNREDCPNYNDYLHSQYSPSKINDRFNLCNSGQNGGPWYRPVPYSQDEIFIEKPYEGSTSRTVGNVFHRYNEYQIWNTEHSPFCLMDENTIHPKVSASKYEIDNEFVDASSSR